VGPPSRLARARRMINGLSPKVRSVAFSPDLPARTSGKPSSSADRTARIWDVTTGHSRALMRVERFLYTCAWVGGSGRALGGRGGPELCASDFLPGHALT
jgi:hypothetical protein